MVRSKSYGENLIFAINATGFRYGEVQCRDFGLEWLETEGDGCED